MCLLNKMKLLLLFTFCYLHLSQTEGLWKVSNEFVRSEHNNQLSKPDRPQLNHYWHKKWKRNQQDIDFRVAGNSIGIIDPPDHTKLIAMARYVLHNSLWCSIATISTSPAIAGFPFTNVKSIVDGSLAKSTGVPYFYMAPADFTAKDLSKNSRATVLVSLEETGYCKQQQFDPQDPRCTRLMLSGKMKKIIPGSDEYNFAKAALFERHPDMANYPADHNWFVAKMKIVQVAMVDWFGGAKYIPVRDYLAYNYTGTEIINYFYDEGTDGGD